MHFRSLAARAAMILVMMTMAAAMFAVPAKPGLNRTLTLADGSTVSAMLVGDEYQHYWLGADGNAYRAVGNDIYESFDPAGDKKVADNKRSASNQRRARRLGPRKVGNVGNITGDKKGLIILVNFQDVTFTATQSDFYNLANSVNYNSGNYKGSMYDYFYAQSEGKFRLKFDVVGPYTLSNNCAHYGGNDSNGDDLRPGEMVKEAVQLANNDVDFANYDWDGNGEVEQVYVVYAGKGEADGGDDDTIWPHEWALSSATGSSITLDGKIINTYACGGEQNGETGETAGIGTMCHEFSHCLGYPDFYDTDYSGGQGMFRWDLMDSGSYNGDGYQPAGYTSYERWVAGWKTPTELLYTQTISNMKALQDNGSDTYIIYNKGNRNEYYLLENRQKTGWDASLPGAGLLIVHVDYNSSEWSYNTVNDDPDHQRMTWIAADNNYQYTIYKGTKYYTQSGAKNDPFPYGSNNSFGKNTTPAATLYNKNSDNTYYLDSSITDITQNSDGTISFNFNGLSDVATPTFSPIAGRYTEAQTVTINCTTAGATIYYTLDGSTPSTESSVYSSPLTISETTTIKAYAVKNGEHSALATAIFTIGAATSNPNTKTFRLVTSTSDLQNGMRYIIACGSQATAGSYLIDSYLSKIGVNVNNDIITINDKVAVFVLEGDQTNGWTIMNENDAENKNKYLISNAAKNLAYSTEAKRWTLSNGTDGVIMTFGDYGTMLFNANSPRFNTYTSAPNVSMIQANLYIEDSSAPQPAIVADNEMLTFSTTVGTPQTLNFEVLSEALTEDITATLTLNPNNVFSLESTTISRTASEQGATCGVTFTPTAAGNFAGKVTLTSEGADPVNVDLVATATEAATPDDPAGQGNEFALVTEASDFVEGDYIIVYNGGAMNTTLSSDRLQYTEVTPNDDVITTDDATIIWHIAPSGDYYTIYNAGEGKYAAGTGVKNKAQLLASSIDDKSLWSVSTGGTFDFTNKANAAINVNATLRRNGEYGFACYSSSTGGRLSLYKRTGSSGTTDPDDPEQDYYKNADGKKGSQLKTVMCGIIYNRTTISYDDLWTAFCTTDVRSDGKIWDMYSNITNYAPVSSGSTYSKEGDCYNREHSFPQSWFGSNTPMYTDLHHIYPTDGFVNGKRSNYPFGETNGNSYKSANDFSKLGDCTVSDYSGTVFEPADEYKGDFARTYFYMVTCYEEKLHDWFTNYSSTEVTAVLDGNTYPGLKTWQLNMLMKWAKNDPVSEKETARNNAVYAIQKNRNPFIDYPGLEEYIWGTMTTMEFSYDNYVQPDYTDDPVVGSGDYALVTDASTLAAGDKILIAYVNGNDKYVLSTTQNTNNRTATNDVTLNTDGTLTPGTAAQVITLEKDGDNYLFNVGNGYLYAASSSKNYLKTEENADDNAKATISISSNNATITFIGEYTNNIIRYNPNNGSPLFSCYSSNTGSLPQIYRELLAPSITINNDGNGNSSTITDYDGKIVNVTLANRTLFKDGAWNTLCLPFSMTEEQIASSYLKNADIRTLSTSSLNNGTLSLNFTPSVSDGTVNGVAPVTSIIAGTPYIIKWESNSNIVDPVFYGVTIDKSVRNKTCDLGNVGAGGVPARITFKGTYEGLTYDDADYSILFIGEHNTLYYPTANASIGAQRAYFELEGITAGDKTDGVRSFVLNFGNESTDIKSIDNLRISDLRFNTGAVYDLSGRKIENGKAVTEGIYIHNGKKVVVK